MAADTHTIGGRLLVLRQRRGMTQQQLADHSGISVGIIRKLEQGQRQSVRLETLTALAHAWT
ncbi:helix-turn-helix domain-containing protein [Actinoplanes sp. Pm04-4]|uniref:Helix-turn-helix domain-containing protein n=1 Tax=Paractinoplanes pyxinae TaxID=2997416 RepID=A0ABT4B4R7_9ACTN|nr:helix-turn-helix domain-containing protein [Actinoplanes pyxinae]MCY1141470.1 helix-turn-helix domain-containing protein [Actinoplanes pyxinae]